jgi:Domain of unknown function (DUF6438)
LIIFTEKTIFKMKNIGFLLCLLVLIAVACGKKTTETVTVKPMPAPPAAAKDVQVAKGGLAIPGAATQSGKINIPEGIDPNVIVSLKRSPCFGKCPAFEMQLFADGKAVYNGGSNVELVGRYETEVSPEFTKMILAQAQSIKFMGLKNRYPEGDMQISDVPTSYSYIRIGNEGKLVVNNHDAPVQLIEFERFVEAQFNNLKWQKVKE